MKLSIAQMLWEVAYFPCFGEWPDNFICYPSTTMVHSSSGTVFPVYHLYSGIDFTFFFSSEVSVFI